MDKTTDRYLKNALKNWASSCPPPRNGKARLLWAASRPALRPRAKAAAIASTIGGFLAPPAAETVSWSGRIFSWASVYTFQNRFASLRLIV